MTEEKVGGRGVVKDPLTLLKPLKLLRGIYHICSFVIFHQEMFLGHAIQDEQPAIIHHFAFHQDPSQFSFPDFSAGWALSVPLLNRQVRTPSSLSS